MKAKDLLAACFVLFGLLLSWPLLTAVNRLTLVFGIPALVLYLFFLWAVIVAVTFVVARRLGAEGSP